MARYNYREIVLMLLAILIGLGMLSLIGASLFRQAANPIPPGNGGVAFVVGGISAKLLVSLIVVLIAAVVGLALVLWKR